MLCCHCTQHLVMWPQLAARKSGSGFFTNSGYLLSRKFDYHERRRERRCRLTNRVCKGGLAFWGQAQLLLTPRLPGICWRKGDGSWPGKPLVFTLTWVLGHNSRGPSPAEPSPCAPAGTPAWQGPTPVPEMLTHLKRRAEGNCADGSLRCRPPPVCYCLLRSCRSFQPTALCRVGPRRPPRAAGPWPSGTRRQLQHHSSRDVMQPASSVRSLSAG